MLRTVSGEDGESVTGGVHLADARPGGTADPVALGWQQRYMLDDLVADALGGGHNIAATVFVDAGTMYRKDGPPSWRCVGETEFVNGIAAAGASGVFGDCELCAGIVSTADLLLPAAQLEPILQAHLAASSRFRGVRVLGYDFTRVVPDPRFAEAMALLAKYDLVFDVGVQTDTVATVVLLATTYPEVTFILNHCGGTPGPEAFAVPGVEEKWRAGISAVGACPNVCAKVGGCQMTFNGLGISSAEREKPVGSEELVRLTKGIYTHVIKSFGPERCMWESNFPVDT